MTAVPLAISSQSRSKPVRPELLSVKELVKDKENIDTHDSQKIQDNLKKALTEQGGVQSRQNFPQTPGPKHKIDFADLIANPEDEFNRQITATPKEQVDWKHGPTSSATPYSGKTTQQSRKRAYSSSPTSQQGRRSKHFVVDRNPLDLESISRSLRTPKQEDPLSALWDRYAETLERGEQNEPTLPPLPPLSSSPNTPGINKGDNLRRTASCGLEWPTSAAKRRRLTAKDPQTRAQGMFAASRHAILGRDHSRMSRVGLLVDSIQQSLQQKTIPEEETPASPSPIPDRRDDVRASPKKSSGTFAQPHQHQPTAQHEDQSDHDLRDKSSDFGDMDFDPDDPELLVALDRAATQPAPSLHHIVTAAPFVDGSLVHNQSTEINVAHKKPADRANDQQCHPGESATVSHNDQLDGSDDVLKENDDSFDDFEDGDDAFANELAELADMVESQNVTEQSRKQPVQTSTETQIQHLPQDEALDEFEDAFNDNDDDDRIWKQIDETATQTAALAKGSMTQTSYNNKAIKRYLILDVSEGYYDTPQGRVRPEKVLRIKDEKTRQVYLVHLRQSWYDTRGTKSSYVHLIGNFDQHGSCIVDDINNMIILHPDHLISATVVADSFSCTRRAILQDRIKATSPAEAPQVYGHLLHEIFGAALKQNDWEMDALRELTWKILPTYLESLYEINVQPQDAVEYVMSKMPELKAWACIFVTASLTSDDAAIRDRNGVTVPTAINKLLELEEHIWSPMYGLKGNVDATVQAQMRLPGERSIRTLTVPLELKTGKRDTNEMHRAQTALYTLLLSDRYDINVTSGILYYLETSRTFRVEGVRNEIRHMIIQRNELACYVHDKLALPPMIKREHLCKKCYAQTSCFTYHKLAEDGDGNSSAMKQVFDDAVGHLKPVQQVFFKKWDDLLTKEERDAMKFKRELWTMLSNEREAVGRCFSNVMIEQGSASENGDSPKINRYTYTFVKRLARPGFSFMESQITTGEPIVISDEQGHFALANGFVTSVRPTRISVAVDRRLQNARQKKSGFHPDTNQVFSGIMEVGKEGGSSARSCEDQDSPISYRIDKDEFANGMATARNNIIRIMEKDLWRARELRQLIIETKAPIFKEISTAYSLSGPKSQQDLNVDQRRAIEKVMSARDYALVLGMPGTGKTTTIAHIIRALVSQGKSVLLTSYTHTAVDNILLKIKDDNIPILRLGALGKIHPDVQSFVDLGNMPKKTMAELEKSWTTSKVVATTCLGINHAIFNHRKFDYCIVDEASQITLPVCLGPIRMASAFVLVGDHYQLPPLVQNKEAQEGGLDVSLFKLLSDAQPSSVVNLEHQYRMAEDIQLLSNELIYSGRLKCGTPGVASRKLHISQPEAALEAHHYSSNSISHAVHPTVICNKATSTCWLQTVLDPDRRTIFLNTDTITAQTSAPGASEIHFGTGNGMRITNPVEAMLIAQTLTTLVRAGVPPRSIGVITFYRSQLALLKTTVKAMAGSNTFTEIEMHTADKYQGRDKEVILLSCVRSNDLCNVGELLKDWRRVNVSLTRARSKLIIIGSSKTLKGSAVPVLSGMVRISQEKGWIIDLPVEAPDLHFFEGRGTQTQFSQPQRSQQARPNGNVTRILSPRKAELATSRQPLGITDNNIILGSNRNAARKPAKVIRGSSVNVDKVLDKRPLLRNVVEDVTGLDTTLTENGEFEEMYSEDIYLAL